MTPRLTAGYSPGAIGRIAELHARYYSRHWQFGLFFEAKVATEMAAFLQRFDPATDGFWTAAIGDTIEGGIAIDGANDARYGAHLRWFIVSDALRQQGAGNLLLISALDFCRQAGHPSIYLWTFEGLAPARHLYEKYGFRLAEAHAGTQWGTQVVEQKFILDLRQK
ncbi:MAG: GNAT family N-acetyltransferase [Pseudomonadota bacterium]